MGYSKWILITVERNRFVMNFLTGEKEISTGVIFFLWCVLVKLQVNIIVSRSPHKMKCLKKNRKGKDQALGKVQSRETRGGVGIFISVF